MIPEHNLFCAGPLLPTYVAYEVFCSQTADAFVLKLEAWDKQLVEFLTLRAFFHFFCGLCSFGFLCFHRCCCWSHQCWIWRTYLLPGHPGSRQPFLHLQLRKKQLFIWLLNHWRYPSLILVTLSLTHWTSLELFISWFTSGSHNRGNALKKRTVNWTPKKSL